MGDRINEIKLDIEDLNSLLKNATRQKSKDLIGIEIRKLQSELIKQTSSKTETESFKSNPNSHSTPKCYDIKLNNYAWDQTDEFVKLYVTLNNVQSLPKEAVYCDFSERSINLHIIGLENKNYQLPINNLCENIDGPESYVKVKTDMVIVYLSKKAKKTWKCVTSVEKSLKESKLGTPTPDADDPNATIMNLMKKMYQEGDDEMKKTIAKAWTESQEKRQFGMDNFPEE